MHTTQTACLCLWGPHHWRSERSRSRKAAILAAARRAVDPAALSGCSWDRTCKWGCGLGYCGGGGDDDDDEDEEEEEEVDVVDDDDNDGDDDSNPTSVSAERTCPSSSSERPQCLSSNRYPKIPVAGSCEMANW
jgi:hypothetical protein